MIRSKGLAGNVNAWPNLFTPGPSTFQVHECPRVLPSVPYLLNFRNPNRHSYYSYNQLIPPGMASSGGLTRRRGAGGGAGPSNSAGEDEDISRVTSPVPKKDDSRAPETSYTGGENGHKIAFDPRDISESEERNKQPKLTLMEEVLLMGLKDKQVGSSHRVLEYTANAICTGISLVLER